MLDDKIEYLRDKYPYINDEFIKILQLVSDDIINKKHTKVYRFLSSINIHKMNPKLINPIIFAKLIQSDEPIFISGPYRNNYLLSINNITIKIHSDIIKYCSSIFQNIFIYETIDLNFLFGDSYCDIILNLCIRQLKDAKITINSSIDKYIATNNSGIIVILKVNRYTINGILYETVLFDDWFREYNPNE